MTFRAEPRLEGGRPPSAPAAGGGELPLDWLQVGLTASAVAARVAAGATNQVDAAASQSLSVIFRRNALTRLNLLLVTLGGATLATGSGPDATFLAIAVINTVVGSVQEVRAKRALDALAVIN